MTSCHLKCRNLEDCVAYGTLTNVMMGKISCTLSDEILANRIFGEQSFQDKLKILAVLSAEYSYVISILCFTQLNIFKIFEISGIQLELITDF